MLAKEAKREAKLAKEAAAKKKQEQGNASAHAPARNPACTNAS
jgi:hypothetical protein